MPQPADQAKPQPSIPAPSFDAVHLRLTLDIAAAHTTGRLLAPHSRELLDRTLVWNQAHLRRILSQYETHHNQHRPHRCLHAAAPLKPLPEPVDLEQYRVRRHARAGGLINEYRLIA